MRPFRTDVKEAVQPCEEGRHQGEESPGTPGTQEVQARETGRQGEAGESDQAGDQEASSCGRRCRGQEDREAHGEGQGGEARLR